MYNQFDNFRKKKRELYSVDVNYTYNTCKQTLHSFTKCVHVLKHGKKNKTEDCSFGLMYKYIYLYFKKKKPNKKPKEKKPPKKK